jgi:hypothetical protein
MFMDETGYEARLEGYMGNGPNLEQLLLDLHSGDTHKRYSALQRLALVGDARAVPVLMEVLCSEKD